MSRVCALSAVLLLSSCSMVGRAIHRQPSSDPDHPEVVLDQPKGLFGPTTASLKMPGAAANNPANSMMGGALPASAGGAAPSTGGMFDFSSAFQSPGQNRLAHWRRSGADAIEEARRRGLPLLMLFVHKSSPPAQDMDTALSSTAELSSDTPRFIPLRLDYSDKDTLDSDYYRALRDRYRLKGYPVLILALPDGTELTRQSGCTKDWRNNVNHWLDDAASRARSGIDAHRRRLEGKKYRLWKNKDGQEVYARLDGQDANKLVFTNEWGETIHTFVNRLSEADQQRIESKQF